jgi:2-dehydropantoate 2-reductase
VTEHPDRPRVLVFGAGAVGSFLGGILSGIGYDVTLLGRPPWIAHIQEHGLCLQLPDRRLSTHPTTVTSLEELHPPFDIVLLSLRAFAVRSALQSLPAILAEHGVLITVQNGIGTDEIVAQHLPGIAHIAASLTMSADIAGPGMVESTSRSGGIALAPVSHGAPVEFIAAMFRTAGMSAMVHDDYRSMKWSKLLLNQMANGIPAILNWTPGAVYRDPAIFRLEQVMLRETIQVLDADGARLTSLPGFPVPLLRWVLSLPPYVARLLLLGRVLGGRGNKLPSLLLDIQSGRTETESDWLYGAIAEQGKRLNIKTPANHRINRILKGIAINSTLRQAFQDQPERLLRNVALALHEHHTPGSTQPK